MNVDFCGYLPNTQIFIDAGIEKGFPFISDINGRHTMGYVNLQLTCHKGRRQSTAKAYLSPIKRRMNLHIIKYGLVDKVYIDENKRAYGIRYYRNGKTMTVYARREIILSAGSIMSPVILMLSGIGPKEHLQGQKITTKFDLPVGKNLIDHIYTSMYSQFDPIPTDPNADLDDTFNLAIHNSGTFTELPTVHGFIDPINNTAEFPTIQVLNSYSKHNTSSEYLVNTDIASRIPISVRYQFSYTKTDAFSK